jgi:hypothetical protein
LRKRTEGFQFEFIRRGEVNHDVFAEEISVKIPSFSASLPVPVAEEG